jgi:hypothetical protein
MSETCNERPTAPPAGEKRRLVTAIVLVMTVAGSAWADDLYLMTRDIRQSERLIVAAMETGDNAELKKQRLELSIMVRKIAEITKPGEARWLNCVMAAQTLANVVADLALPPARAKIALEDDEKLYQEYMRDCEAAERASR